MASDQRAKNILYLSLLAVAVVASYLKIFHAGFISWDDAEYVLNNSDIMAISGENISRWFSGFYIGNYHPLTMFSYAIDFAIGKQEPLIYHIINILLHIFNAVFVFQFIKKLQQSSTIAFFVALIFAVHPMQTESVSWVAERKTLLFAFFFFLALLQYISYIKTLSGKKWASVFVLGMLAMLSKGVAVTLPVTLLAVDIWMGRHLKEKKVWLEKLPLVIASIILGLVAIKAQASGKMLGLHTEYSFFDTLIFAGYAYVQYIVHLLVPVKLSVIYPYPEIGFVQYLYTIIALGILALGIIACRKKWYVLAGGILFYTVNIAIVLQFVQFGDALVECIKGFH